MHHRTAPQKPHDGNSTIQNLQKKTAKKSFSELHTGGYCSSRALSPPLTSIRLQWLP